MDKGETEPIEVNVIENIKGFNSVMLRKCFEKHFVQILQACGKDWLFSSRGESQGNLSYKICQSQET